MIELASGFFAILGAVVGGFFTYMAARVGHRWSAACRHIHRLTDQVAAYHALEHEYMHSLYQADPGRGAPATIQTAMRDRVERHSGFSRPKMTAKQARELADRY